MRSLIVIAGLPGSGKTTLGKFIEKALHIPMISKDSIKEALFDTVGFRCRAEKTRLNQASLKIMFYFAEQILHYNGDLIMENNFEHNAYVYFEQLKKEYNANILTVHVGGDLRVIYERYLSRNQNSDRHPGHVTSAEYIPGQKGTVSLTVPSFEEFKEDFGRRGMMNFHVGEHIIDVDVTDFGAIDYEKILSQIREIMDRHSV